MLPTLFRLGSFEVSAFGALLAIGFIVWAFTVWRVARDKGLEDDTVLDNIIVTASLAFIGARAGFVATHWSVFTPQFLRIFVIWRFPGLSYIGALLGGLMGIYFFTRSQKLPQKIILAGYGLSLPVALFFVSVAVFLDGSVVGKESSKWWALPAVGVAGLRHPVGFYGMVLGLASGIIMWVLRKFLARRGVDSDRFNWWFGLFILGLSLAVLAFFRDDLLYLKGISLEVAANTVMIGTSLVFIFLLLKGQEKLKSWWTNVSKKISRK